MCWQPGRHLIAHGELIVFLYARGSIPPPHDPAGHKEYWLVVRASERAEQMRCAGSLAGISSRMASCRSLNPEGAAQAALQKQTRWVGRRLVRRSRPKALQTRTSTRTPPRPCAPTTARARPRPLTHTHPPTPPPPPPPPHPPPTTPSPPPPPTHPTTPHPHPNQPAT